MIDSPLVSVVIPCLNRAHYLPTTINSVLNQDYARIECIVVDAGSTDGSLDILRGYGHKLRWVSRPDNGAFDAINEGWKMSAGEILAWLNADDEWVVPGAVSAAVQYLQQHPEADVVYGDCGGIDEAGKLIWYGSAAEWNLNKAVMYCDHIINQPAAFMRRSAVECAGWLYPAWGHDHELWIRIALAGGRLDALRLHLANARIWDGNNHMAPSLFIPAKIATIRRALDDPRLPQELRSRRRRVISNAYLRCLDFLLRPRHWPVAFFLVWKALLTDPGNITRIAAQSLLHLVWVVPAIRRLLQTRYGHGIAVRDGFRPAAVVQD